jgi:hypothetical protein
MQEVTNLCRALDGKSQRVNNFTEIDVHGRIILKIVIWKKRVRRCETYSVTSEYSVILGSSERSNEAFNIIVTCNGDYRWYFVSNVWIYWHLIHTTRHYNTYSAIADLHTLQFTVAHALGFSAFTSRILAKDLSQSHCNFKSHMESSFRLLTHFLIIVL